MGKLRLFLGFLGLGIGSSHLINPNNPIDYIFAYLVMVAGAALIADELGEKKKEAT